MFTFRNMLAIAVFLFGTTFLWMTPLFIGPAATGAMWNVAQALGFLAILGFTVTAWGIFTTARWWRSALAGHQHRTARPGVRRGRGGATGAFH
jgi:hypothetical protein